MELKKILQEAVEDLGGFWASNDPAEVLELKKKFKLIINQIPAGDLKIMKKINGGTIVVFEEPIDVKHD